MGYYVLVEKDAKLMKRCWKWIIIGTLILIIAVSFLTTYAFHALNKNFNSNCISDAELAFKLIEYKNNNNTNQLNANGKPINADLKDETYANKVREYAKEFEEYQLGKRSLHVNEPETDPEHRIPAPLFGIVTDHATNKTPEMLQIQKNDSDFFNLYQIDELNTNWGNSETCDNFYYLPLIGTIVAIVWIVFIVIAGNRGEQTAHTFIHKAWRFVLPAAIFFFVLAILSAIYAASLNSRLNNFCLQMKQQFNITGLPCSLLIDRYSLNDENTALFPSTNFNLSKALPWVVAFLWIMAGLIMLVRCVLGADFELEEVEHYNELTGAALEPQVPTAKVQFADKMENYTKERTYTPAKRPERIQSNDQLE